MKYSTRAIRSLVQSRKPFRTYGALYAETIGNFFVVYSYGTHWPLFAFDETTGEWYENSDRYSVTTSSHHSKAHPRCPTILKPVDELRALLAR